MSLDTNLQNLVTRIATVIKTDRVRVYGSSTGDLSQLSTTNKASIIAAINEIAAGAGSGPTDGVTQAQMNAAIASAITDLKDSAPAALDTLKELAAALGGDAAFSQTVLGQIAAKAADSAVVKLTGNQTVAGVKTFSSAPLVPDGSWTIADTSGLQTALDAKASTSALTAKQDASAIGSTATNYVAIFDAGIA